ncbi:glycosyltransferase family 2 protein [Candidatus Saccharibacteria bacterium]|nr:glycosyltransferase family 2 protein [Candidatus Saccharibacteria bacterium]
MANNGTLPPSFSDTPKEHPKARPVTPDVFPVISVVTPAYNEEKNISLFYERTAAVFAELPFLCEIVFVDDGSRDGTAGEIARLKNQPHTRVKFLQLSRNFGKEVAVTAGLHEASGDAVIILDVDLQHPPEIIPQFIAKWSSGADVVIGVRKQHNHEGVIKSWGSKLFYRIMNRISEVDIVPHSTDFRLLDRQVIDEFKKFTERSRITRGLIDWLGFNRDYIYFKADERQHGVASYNLQKLFRLAFHSITSHSLFPLKLAGYLGVVLTLAAGALGLFVIFENYVFNDAMGLQISNVMMLAIFTVFLIGIILMCLGLIAMYIAAIHAEVSNRPLYVLRRGRPGAKPTVEEMGQEPLS